MLNVFLSHYDLKLGRQQLVRLADTDSLQRNISRCVTILLMRIPVSGDLRRNRPHVSSKLQTTSIFWLVKSSNATLKIWKMVWAGVILNFVSSARYRMFWEGKLERVEKIHDGMCQSSIYLYSGL
jgi:hypothetical protein